MKAYKLEVLILDFDDLRAEAIRQVIERTRYPNDSINPSVMEIQEADIGDWTDEHPLNKKSTAKAEYDRLFSAAPPAAPVAAVPVDLVALIVDRDTPPDNHNEVVDHDITGKPITRGDVLAWSRTPPSDGVTSPAEPKFPHPACDDACYYHCTEAGAHPPSCATQAIGVDTPELDTLFDAALNEYWEPEKHKAALIAHIDARIEAARLEADRAALHRVQDALGFGRHHTWVHLIASIEAFAATQPASGGVAEDAALLDFMAADKCMIDHSPTAEGKIRYSLSWPYLYEEQGETFDTPREAIAAAIAARAALNQKGRQP